MNREPLTLSRHTELTDLLKDLVAISSLSGEESAVQAFIRDWFSRHGLAASLESVDGGLQNLIVRVDGSGPGRTLFLGGHCDTVSAGAGWQTSPHEAQIDANRLYGLGALDMKAGLAAAMMVVRTLAQQKHDWSGRLIFAALADEELHSRGASSFMRSAEPIDAAIMCEPHFSAIGVGAIGKVNVKIEVSGRSAHASHPQLGINAVTEAARFLVALDSVDRECHPQFGRASHCVLNMSTGDGRYKIRVPDRCEMLINWHFMPGETPQGAVRMIHDLCAGLGSNAEFSVSLLDPTYESFLLDEDDQTVALLKDCIASIAGRDAQTEFCSGVSDANIFAGRRGIPTLLFGPGGEGMHSANEWVDLDEMAQCREIYTAFALRFLSEKYRGNSS